MEVSMVYIRATRRSDSMWSVFEVWDIGHKQETIEIVCCLLSLSLSITPEQSILIMIGRFLGRTSTSLCVLPHYKFSELARIEPMTSGLQVLRSTNWANEAHNKENFLI